MEIQKTQKVINIKSVAPKENKNGGDNYWLVTDTNEQKYSCWTKDLAKILSDASFEGYALECDVDVGEKYQTIRSAKKTDKVVDSQQEINGGSIPPTLDKSKSKLKSTIDLERNYAKLPAGTYNRDKAITAVTLTSYAKDMCNAMVGCSMEQATKDVIDAYKKILESI